MELLQRSGFVQDAPPGGVDEHRTLGAAGRAPSGRGGPRVSFVRGAVQGQDPRSAAGGPCRGRRRATSGPKSTGWFLPSRSQKTGFMPRAQTRRAKALPIGPRAQDAAGLARQAHAQKLVRSPPLPGARSHQRLALRDPAGHRQQQGQGEIRRGVRQHPGGVDDPDAALFARPAGAGGSRPTE